MASTRTKDGWIVHGQQRNSGWTLLLIAVLIGVLVVLAYQRFMNFDTITYELRQCDAPLTAESTWSEVEDAGCEPMDAAESSFVIYEEASRHNPDSVEGSAFVFESFPVNSILHVAELTLAESAESVVVAEPANEQMRVALRRNTADGKVWSGYVGDRGPTEYWILVTPAP